MISVVINTYNAERYLAECLEAVKDFDEIVVCDMESTDRTVEIAQRYGCKIVTYPKGDCVSAEPARTFAIQSASSEWVLVVDSDEIITPELRKYLYERTQADDGVKGLYIARLNKIFGVYNRGMVQRLSVALLHPRGHRVASLCPYLSQGQRQGGEGPATIQDAAPGR